MCVCFFLNQEMMWCVGVIPQQPQLVQILEPCVQDSKLDIKMILMLGQML